MDFKSLLKKLQRKSKQNAEPDSSNQYNTNKPGNIIYIDTFDELRDEKPIPVSQRPLPCPIGIAMANACLCMRCARTATCCIEAAFRAEGCEQGFPASCQAYVNEEDMHAESKREIFKAGRVFDPVVKRFNRKVTTE